MLAADPTHPSCLRKALNAIFRLLSCSTIRRMLTDMKRPPRAKLGFTGGHLFYLLSNITAHILYRNIFNASELNKTSYILFNLVYRSITSSHLMFTDSIAHCRRFGKLFRRLLLVKMLSFHRLTCSIQTYCEFEQNNCSCSVRRNQGVFFDDSISLGYLLPCWWLPLPGEVSRAHQPNSARGPSWRCFYPTDLVPAPTDDTPVMPPPSSGTARDYKGRRRTASDQTG